MMDANTQITIGNATIYHGDALEILPRLGQCADMLVSDPPYIEKSAEYFKTARKRIEAESFALTQPNQKNLF